jgi:hypothetical protein
MRTVLLLLGTSLSILGVTLVACSDDDKTSPTTTADASAADSSTTNTTDSGDTKDSSTAGPTLCGGEAGYKGNSKGVGAYCTAAGGQCASPNFCTADFGGYPVFCSTGCSSDVQCGDGATCVDEGGQKACVPAACFALLPDGGGGGDDGGDGGDGG